MNKRFLISIWMFLLMTHQLYAFDIHVDALAGYRHDELTTLIEAYDPSDVFLLSDDLKAKNLNIYEIGLKGRLSLCGFMVKGFGTIGKVYNGKYTERVEDSDNIETVTRSDIYSGHTCDASIGAGYLFSLFNIYAGPVGGWSYHSQKIKMRDAETDSISDSALDGLTYKMRWEGPWIGLEGGCRLFCIEFSAGYEYHWPHWHADWLLDGPDVSGGPYSDRRKAHDGYGQVAFIDAAYVFYNYFTLGAELKYQYWKAKNGHEKPKNGSFSDVGLNDTEVDRIPRATWKSWEIQLTLGYHF